MPNSLSWAYFLLSYNRKIAERRKIDYIDDILLNLT